MYLERPVGTDLLIYLARGYYKDHPRPAGESGYRLGYGQTRQQMSSRAPAGQQNVVTHCTLFPNCLIVSISGEANI